MACLEFLLFGVFGWSRFREMHRESRREPYKTTQENAGHLSARQLVSAADVMVKGM